MDGIRIAIRRAASSDIGLLVELHIESRDTIRPERGGTVDIALQPAGRQSADLAAWYEATLDDERRRVLIGTVDGHVVAALIHAIIDTSDGPLGRVEQLWVTPAARGVGVGAALMNAAVAIAKDAGCYGVDARALPGDRSTKNFFESFGLVARSLVVHQAFEENA